MDNERFLRLMALIRETETKLLELFSKGLLNGTVHTCIGQEACAVGVIEALDREKDILFSNHRGHGHYLAYCSDVKGLIAEVMGLPNGVCKGLGGSQHLQFNNFYTNGIQGAGLPIVAGMALAEKINQTGAIAVAFMGDGTFGEGVVYEAFNIASLWRLPVLIVVENNRYAQSTPSIDQHAGALEDRARAFDIPVTVVNGMRVDEVHAAAKSVVARIRDGNRPEMLFLETYRYAPHSKGDDFRDPREIAEYRQYDPLDYLRILVDECVGIEIIEETRAYVNQVVQELVDVS